MVEILQEQLQEFAGCWSKMVFTGNRPGRRSASAYDGARKITVGFDADEARSAMVVTVSP